MHHGMKRRTFIQVIAAAVVAALVPVQAIRRYLRPRTLYVQFSLGDDGNSGLSPSEAVTTISEAIRRDNVGTIVVLPGHCETVPERLDFSNGTSVIGLGRGKDRPRFTYVGDDA